MDDESTTESDLDLVLPQKSLLVATAYKLVRVNCPFEVVCIQPVNNFTLGQKVKVDQVQDWDRSTILFHIRGKWYRHCWFKYIPPTRIVITGLR